MYRLYDFECGACGARDEHLVDVPRCEPVPRVITADCRHCAQECEHERIVSLPAPYMGERLCNPLVHGGRFDTTGNRALTPLPDLPAGVEHNSDNYSQLFASRDYREAQKTRSVEHSQNLAKRKRLAAYKRGEQVNFKRDRCPGDPKH